MEEAPRPRRDGDESAPADPRFGEADAPNAIERRVVAADYPTAPLASDAHPDGSATRMINPRRAWGGIARARDVLLDWVQREPEIALGAALALGFVVGFALRRSVLLSAWEHNAWETREVKRV